jgi:hypothetical protein
MMALKFRDDHTQREKETREAARLLLRYTKEIIETIEKDQSGEGWWRERVVGEK